MGVVGSKILMVEELLEMMHYENCQFLSSRTLVFVTVCVVMSLLYSSSYDFSNELRGVELSGLNKWRIKILNDAIDIKQMRAYHEAIYTEMIYTLC